MTEHPMIKAVREAGLEHLLPARYRHTANQIPIRDPHAPTVAADDPAAQRWVAAMLAANCAELANATKGTRNDTLYRKAFRVGTFVAGGYLDAHQAQQALVQAAAEAGLPDGDPHEVHRTIRSAFTAAQQVPAILQLDPTPSTPETFVIDVGHAVDTKEEEASRFINGADFIFNAPDTLDSVWGDGQQVLWASGESLIFVGPPGVGKTTLAQQLTLARCGVGDGTFLELPVTPTQSKVLYLAMDRPRQIARSMKRMVCEADRDILAQRLVVWKGPPPADIARHEQSLLALAQSAGADTVVVDSLKDAAVGLVDSEVAGGYNRARQTALAAGVEVLEIAHPRKRGGADARGNKNIDDLHGGMEIVAGAGSVVAIEGEPGDLVVTLHHRKQPLEMVGPMKLRHDHQAGRTTVYEHISPLQVLRNHPHGLLSALDVARVLYEKDKPSAAEQERARYQLNKLVTAGLVTCHPSPNGGRERYMAVEASVATSFEGM